MVRDWLYPQHVSRSLFNFASSQPDRRQDAINLISLWHFRYPQLTHALISTAHLTDAILHDQSGRREKLSSLALRSIYAMNFCRFVNALVDRDVRKSATATIAKDHVAATAAAESDIDTRPYRGTSSMYAHALELGLPESFVELRHQAIHEEMPSLEVLRARTEEGLEWLWERWWKVNVKDSAEAAFSEWEEKHGKLQTKSAQLSASEHEEEHPQSALCPSCRKRRIVEHEGGDEYVGGSGKENEDSHDPNRRKQRKLDSERGTEASRTSEPLRWTMRFYTGLPRAQAGHETHQPEGHG
jgi:Las1-like